jgi:tRNA(fMet)-specific endonuclease VapC
MRYPVDTNIVSDLVRNPQGKVAQRICKVGETQVCTSIVVAAELRYGASKKGSPRLAAQLKAVLGAQLQLLSISPCPPCRFDK